MQRQELNNERRRLCSRCLHQDSYPKTTPKALEKRTADFERYYCSISKLKTNTKLTEQEKEVLLTYFGDGIHQPLVKQKAAEFLGYSLVEFSNLKEQALIKLSKRC